MPRIDNDPECCGMFHVRGMGADPDDLDEWLKGEFAQQVSTYVLNDQNGKVYRGKLYQCTIAAYQWTWAKHRVMLANGWKKRDKWYNSSGSVIRLYTYVPKGAERTGA